ncbi:MAG: serine/threonine-protein kinase [Myxococcota bacterium]
MAADSTYDPDPSLDTRTIADHRRDRTLDAKPSREPIERGTSMGRYLVLDEIGEGGMGVVVRAYDPKLHREVALKRLHRGTLDAESQARLFREAQAMAQLSHPNVITIHDVERTERGVIMAMEFVEGQTLSKWIAEGPHPWAEVVERFKQAGRGLLAAHQAGLVHRDFKPSNVITGHDGRVQVMDFGLARAEPTQYSSDSRISTDEPETPDPMFEPDPSMMVLSADASGSLDVPLTEAGLVMGTPAYMAPEQHRGDVADARCDQYAFCVSLWEGLWGTRPFEGNHRAIALAKHGGPPPLPREPKVPRALQDIVRRGLSPKAGERFPSMAELIDALERDPTTQSRRWRTAAGAVVVAAGVTGVVLAGRSSAPAPCEDASAQLEGIWDDTRRAEVRGALRDTSLSYAENTWKRVSTFLDDYAQTWAQMHTEACEATAVRRVQSEALLDVRMQCLRRRKLHLEAVVEVLATADEAVAKTAIRQVMNLPPIERCADVDALMAAVAPPEQPAIAAEVEEIRDALARVIELGHARRYDEAQVVIDGLLERARATDYTPIVAEVLRITADLSDLQGNFARAEREGTEAFELALQSGHDTAAADIASAMLFLTANRQVNLDKARVWSTAAVGLAQAVRPGGRRHARSINGLGVLAYHLGDFAVAKIHFERAIEMLIQVEGEKSDTVANTYNHLGAILDEQGRYKEAQRHFERALKIHLELYGENHPWPTRSMDNLALSLQAQGLNERSRDMHVRVLEIRRQAQGERHPNVGLAHNNLGWDYMGLDEYDKAADHFEHALAIFVEALGDEHPRVGMAAESLAEAEQARERYAASEVLHRRALRIRRKALGDEHPNVALSYSGLGKVATSQGRYEDAIEQHGKALAITEKKPEGMERRLAEMLLAMGQAQLGAGHFADARKSLERSRTVMSESSDPQVLGALYFALAEANEGDGGDPQLARDHAEKARSLLADQTTRRATELRGKVDAWLAKPAPQPSPAPD